MRCSIATDSTPDPHGAAPRPAADSHGLPALVLLPCCGTAALPSCHARRRERCGDVPAYPSCPLASTDCLGTAAGRRASRVCHARRRIDLCVYPHAASGYCRWTAVGCAAGAFEPPGCAPACARVFVSLGVSVSPESSVRCLPSARSGVCFCLATVERMSLPAERTGTHASGKMYFFRSPTSPHSFAKYFDEISMSWQQTRCAVTPRRRV